MRLDRTPAGARIAAVEEWLGRVGVSQNTPEGSVVRITPEMLCDFAEWVAAAQREAIAQALESMPDGTWAKHCADAVRTLRAEH